MRKARMSPMLYAGHDRREQDPDGERTQPQAAYLRDIDVQPDAGEHHHDEERGSRREHARGVHRNLAPQRC